VSTDFIEGVVRFSKGWVKGHEGTKASKDSVAASEAASYPLAASNGLAEGAKPLRHGSSAASLRSPCLPLSPQVLQGSTTASKAAGYPRCLLFLILRPILVLFSSKGRVSLPRQRCAARPPYPEYNIVIYNLLLVPLQGSPNILLFASTLNVLLPYDNVDTIDALFVA
jgi:hypothetical protein